MSRPKCCSFIFIATMVCGTVFSSEFTARGSDSTIHLVKALAEAYKSASGNTVIVEGGGSGKAAKACLAGEVPLAFLSRNASSDEKSAGLQEVPYALDAAVVIVNKANPVANLTVAELRDYFSGTKDKWSDDKPVVAFNRNLDSGTRELFQHVVMKEVKMSEKAAIKHDAIILSSVSKIPGAIAYTSMGEINDTVKAVSIESIAPSSETIRNKTYVLTRNLVFVTKGAPSADTKAFLDFVTSEQGREVVSKMKFVLLSK